ncbi:EamA family transporter [Coxiella-like endosymbiont of Rhipicephalus sanguineus]|uniref:EamA family transporter n=1 Tax=Coxiella-like endosymbiont of Rhipicephalus sanguineus TaxID=1955402 RepID=UPI00203DD3A5|nr:EamA family transporter [Coxiella-like endosymbiont of Rhipicephalus sanguineus]
MNQFAQVHSALFFLTLLWGLTFPLIKDALSVIPPSLFIVLRLAIASLILLPFILSYRKKTSFTMIKWTVVLSFFQSATYVFQSIELETVSSANSEFLTAFSVVVVSFLALVFLRKNYNGLTLRLHYYAWYAW